VSRDRSKQKNARIQLTYVNSNIEFYAFITKRRKPMTIHRVRFIKDLCDSTGHAHKCVQGVVNIGRARDTERAVRAAKRRFERMKGIKRWDLHADAFELVVDERAPNSP
jgi:hypothetical protein